LAVNALTLFSFGAVTIGASGKQILFTANNKAILREIFSPVQRGFNRFLFNSHLPVKHLTFLCPSF
jgi:hypothetical protein